MTKHLTQKQRIRQVLETVRAGTADIPSEYIRRHPSGDGVSARYFKQVMLISEANGRLTELRYDLAKEGLRIEESTVRDAYGFCYHRLISEPKATRLAAKVSPLPLHLTHDRQAATKAHTSVRT
jgi:hypothetical protein